MKKDFSENKTEYEGKVIPFEAKPERYLSLTEKMMEKEDLLGALSFALSGYKKSPSLEALSDIADIYADMGLYELSNKYWFRYVAKAPKEKVSIAYEELATNYFYMGKMLVSGYYLHLKVNEDGYLTRENLDAEIIEFFEKSANDKSKYRIVYPEEKADYTTVMKEAKKHAMVGEYSLASSKYASIPKSFKDYKKAREELCLCLLLDGNEEALNENKKFIEEFGEDVSILCNLSEIYRIRGDKEKSEYYYERAKNSCDINSESAFKLSTVAVGHKDYLTAVKGFEKFIDENFFDIDVLCLYGLSLLNVGEYEKAYNVYSKAYRIDPENTVSEYFANYSYRLMEGLVDARYLPLKEANEIPKEEAKKRVKKIMSVYNGGREVAVKAFKDNTFCNYIRWAIAEVRVDVIEPCVKLLFIADTKKSKEMIADILCDSTISATIKETMVHISVLCGIKQKYNICIGGFFVKAKAGKPKCENDLDNLIYFQAYATAFSRFVTAGMEVLNKITIATDKVYDKLKHKNIPEDVKKEDIATLIVLESGIDVLKTKNDYINFIGGEPKGFERIYKLYSEEDEND